MFFAVLYPLRSFEVVNFSFKYEMLTTSLFLHVKSAFHYKHLNIVILIAFIEELKYQ